MGRRPGRRPGRLSRPGEADVIGPQPRPPFETFDDPTPANYVARTIGPLGTELERYTLQVLVNLLHRELGPSEVMRATRRVVASVLDSWDL